MCPNLLGLPTGHGASHRFKVNVTLAWGKNMLYSVLCWCVKFFKPPVIKTEFILLVSDLMDRIKFLSRLFVINIYYVYIGHLLKILLRIMLTWFHYRLPSQIKYNL